MAYIRLPLGIKVALEYNLDGKVVVNIYHVTTTDPIVSAKLLEIAQVFAVWFSTSMNVNMSSDISLTGVTALDLDVANGEKVEFPVVPPVVGTVVGGVAPSNVAFVVSMKTALTGRSFQGRTYLPGLGDQEITVNDIGVGRLGVILASFATLDAALAAANTQIVVASFITAGAPRAVGIGTPVDSFVANTRVDTQRRRLPSS